MITLSEAQAAPANAVLAPRKDLEKRSEPPLPEYMQLPGVVSQIYLPIVCSCLITSPFPAQTETSQSTVLTSVEKKVRRICM